MTRTLLLDLDGTLVDSVPDLTAALNRLMAARGLAAFSRPEVTAMVGDGAAVLLERAFAARGVQQDDAALEAFVVDYTANTAVETRPFPGVIAGLDALTAAGWRLAVCTNKPEAAARALLAALGIDHYFAAVGGGDTFPVRKPDPAHLTATLQAAGGDLGRALMSGDHHNDVAAAQGAGVKCIFAAWGYGTAAMGAEAEAVAGDFAEMVRIAGAMLPR